MVLATETVDEAASKKSINASYQPMHYHIPSAGRAHLQRRHSILISTV